MPAQVQQRLKETLAKQHARIISLFREWDVDKSGTVSKSEFRQAMKMLGVDASVKEVDTSSSQHPLLARSPRVHS